MNLYRPERKNEWDTFIGNSKNATFLFNRDFMDYHKDRFEDFSLMIYSRAKLVGVLPANREGSILHSHQGLTYGGLLLPRNIGLEKVIEMFEVVLKFLFTMEIFELHIKEIPGIYHVLPSEEIRYLAFILEAELLSRQTLSVIDNRYRLKFSKGRKEGIRRSQQNKLQVIETDSFSSFWNAILSPNLKSKYGVEPVHSLEEIENLKKKFPQNIKQFNVYHKQNLVAGATIFETTMVAHCQYISGSDSNNLLGSLDALHSFLIDHYQHKRYFDFGSSNEHQGRAINVGLIFWKEGFGARTVTQDFYKIPTENYYKCKSILP